MSKYRKKGGARARKHEFKRTSPHVLWRPRGWPMVPNNILLKKIKTLHYIIKGIV